MNTNPADGPFDTRLLKRRRARGLRGPDYVLELAGEELLARLAQLLGEERLTLPRDGARLVACGPAWLAHGVAQMPELAHARVLRGEWLAAAADGKKEDGVATLVLDHVHLPFADQALHAALVLIDFAFVNDLPKALMEWRRVLTPGGVLLAALPGGETLKELRAAWAVAEQALAAERGATAAVASAGAPAEGIQPGWRVAPFVEVRQLAQLAGMAGFTGVVTDIERLRVRHADALSLMRELKESGWANPLRQRPRVPASRRLLGLAAAHYELACADADGRVSASMELLFLSAHRPPTHAPASSGEACGM